MTIFSVLPLSYYSVTIKTWQRHDWMYAKLLLYIQSDLAVQISTFDFDSDSSIGAMTPNVTCRWFVRSRTDSKQVRGSWSRLLGRHRWRLWGTPQKKGWHALIFVTFIAFSHIDFLVIQSFKHASIIFNCVYWYSHVFPFASVCLHLWNSGCSALYILHNLFRKITICPSTALSLRLNSFDNSCGCMSRILCHVTRILLSRGWIMALWRTIWHPASITVRWLHSVNVVPFSMACLIQ